MVPGGPPGHLPPLPDPPESTRRQAIKVRLSHAPRASERHALDLARLRRDADRRHRSRRDRGRRDPGALRPWAVASSPNGPPDRIPADGAVRPAADRGPEPTGPLLAHGRHERAPPPDAQAVVADVDGYRRTHVV